MLYFYILYNQPAQQTQRNHFW